MTFKNKCYDRHFILQDCNNFGAKKVCLMTDKHLVDLDCVKTVLQSLDDHKVNYKLYSNVRVEPTNERQVQTLCIV